jgi:WD40 repeat protein
MMNMKTPRNCIRKIQLPVLILFIWSETALGQYGQHERIIWTKQDADPYLNVAFSTNGSMLALGREDSNTTDLLNANDGNLIRSLTATHNRTNEAVFTLDDRYLINGNGSSGETLTLDLWRVADGVRLLRLGAHNNGTNSVDLSSDGQYLVTSGIYSREIKVWHVPDLTLLLTIPNNDPQSPGLPPRVKDSAFSPDGQLIGNGDIYGIKLRRTVDGTLVLRIPNPEILSISFSPDGSLIAGAVESERAVKIWRVADGTLVRVLPVLSEFEFPRVAFDPNGKFVAAVYGSSNMAGAVQFWSVREGNSVAIYPKPNHVRTIAFSPSPGIFAYTEYGGQVTVSFAQFLQ